MSTAASGTRLSDLPDDLLQRILYLLPANDAACTAVLSRRWRSLLPTPWCGAGVHIDTRSCQQHRADSGSGGADAADSWESRRDAFIQYTKQALAMHGSVKRLSIRVDKKLHHRSLMFSSYGDRHNLLEDVLSNPACRGVERLSIEARNSGFRFAGRKYLGTSFMPSNMDIGIYRLRLCSIPAAALRDLHLTNCCDLEPPLPATGFPCLAMLNLQRCRVRRDCLQDMILASPRLHTLHLGNVLFRSTDTMVQSLCCPVVTTLFLDNCNFDGHHPAIEFDAPRVRHIRSAGRLDMFLLTSPPPDMERVDLHIFKPEYGRPLERPMSDLFWKFLKAIGSTKVLKLKLRCPIEDIAIADEELLLDDEHEALLFGNLEQLELDVSHRPGSQDAAVAIGNLLRCCPAVTDLKLKLDTVHEHGTSNSLHWNPWEYPADLLIHRSQQDFRKSIDHFKRRRDPVVIPFGEDSDDICNHEVSNILGLVRDHRWLNIKCLQFCLKRVTLKYSVGNNKCSCFAIQLVRLFSQTAMVLEEMCIDDGNRKMCEHMNRKFAGRTANPFQACSEYKVFGPISQEVGAMKKLCTSRVGETLPSISKHQVKSRGFIILPMERYEEDPR